MNILDFKISINRYYKKRIDFILCGVITVLVILTLTEILPVFPIILFSIILLGGGILMYFKEKKQNFEILSFKKNHLIIGNSPPIEVDYMVIQTVILKYYHTKGDGLFSGAFLGPGIPKTGHENTIKITTKDGKKIVKNIWCENEADYWRLKSLGFFLKEQGIEVKMKGFLM